MISIQGAKRWPLWGSCNLSHVLNKPSTLPHAPEIIQPALGSVLSIKAILHLQGLIPPRSNLCHRVQVRASFYLLHARAHHDVVLPLPSQQPSDGLFSPMEVRANHLPMCTWSSGTCPPGMVLHIKNYTLHGLISPRYHSNVNHISSLKLSNICMKSLAHHLRAQRHYTDLLYKAKETDRTTYWANTHKRWKVSSKDYSSHV
jgi:hypothetical protein